MRTRVWNNLANVKFKALYTAQCSRWAYLGGNCYSFILAFASASSVATWAIWKLYPALWASIVGVAQLLHVAKPYVSFIGNDKDYLEMSFEFEGLYLEYERLWYDLENVRIESAQAEKQFYALRQKEIEIEKSHKHIGWWPRFEFLMQRIQRDTNTALALNFEQGVQDEQRKATVSTTAAAV